jgi:hypothetical protein
MAEAKFYTYIHCRADSGAVFYVGKGSCGYYRAYQKTGRSNHWRRVVEKHGLIVEIAAKWQSEAEAFEHERLLIRVLREIHAPLVNVTDGGEGASGAKQSQEHIEKRRLAASRPDAKARKSAALRASWSDPEVRARRLAKFAVSPEELARRECELLANAAAKRAAASEESKRRWANEEYRDKVTESVRRAKNTEAARARQSEITRSLYATPGFLEKIVASTTERSRRPEVRARTSEQFKLLWKNPEHRKRICLPVVCLDTGERFESVSGAARVFGQSKANLHKVCEGKRKTCGGLRFAWA